MYGKVSQRYRVPHADTGMLTFIEKSYKWPTWSARIVNAAVFPELDSEISLCYMKINIENWLMEQTKPVIYALLFFFKSAQSDYF